MNVGSISFSFFFVEGSCGVSDVEKSDSGDCVSSDCSLSGTSFGSSELPSNIVVFAFCFSSLSLASFIEYSILALAYLKYSNLHFFQKSLRPILVETDSGFAQMRLRLSPPLHFVQAYRL